MPWDYLRSLPSLAAGHRLVGPPRKGLRPPRLVPSWFAPPGGGPPGAGLYKRRGSAVGGQLRSRQDGPRAAAGLGLLLRRSSGSEFRFRFGRPRRAASLPMVLAGAPPSVPALRRAESARWDRPPGAHEDLHPRRPREAPRERQFPFLPPGIPRAPPVRPGTAREEWRGEPCAREAPGGRAAVHGAGLRGSPWAGPGVVWTRGLRPPGQAAFGSPCQAL